jgi:hypothetical protein
MYTYIHKYILLCVSVCVCVCVCVYVCVSRYRNREKEYMHTKGEGCWGRGGGTIVGKSGGGA